MTPITLICPLNPALGVLMCIPGHKVSLTANDGYVCVRTYLEEFVNYC